MLGCAGGPRERLLEFHRREILPTPRFLQYRIRSSLHLDRCYSCDQPREASARVAELERPEQPDSPEFPADGGHGYVWRVNNYWRLEEKDGGVYMQVESIALSRDVPAIFAWFVNPLIRRVSHHTLVNLLSATRRGLLNPDAGGTPSTGSRVGQGEYPTLSAIFSSLVSFS